MRVPYLLAAVLLVVAGCQTASPPASQEALQTSALAGAGMVGIMPMTPTMAMPMPTTGQPGMGMGPLVGWPGAGGGMGMGFPGFPGFGGTYELTRFDGPSTATTGDVTLKATGGEYDGCANDYEAQASVQLHQDRGEIRLAVTAKPANRQCFASGHEDSHTFSFPLRLDQAGTYKVLSQTPLGGYRELGSLTVSTAQSSGGSFVYEFTRFDGPISTPAGQRTSISATGGTYDFCGYAFSGSATVDAQNRMVDLSWVGTPHPPGQPRCLAMAQQSHTQAFDVTLPQAGIYTVRTRTANGWRSIGSIAAT